MLYDWRSLDDAPPEAVCFDATTGEFVPLVFQYDTVSHRLGRYQLSADCKGIVVDATTKHPVKIWETRPLRLLWLYELSDALALPHSTACCDVSHPG